MENERLIDISRKANDEFCRIGNEMEYWKHRCLLAEKCLEESTCNPDITSSQIEAHKDYSEFLKENKQP